METITTQESDLFESLDNYFYTEKSNCILEEDYTQCGQIFYSENTCQLKFNCTFCEETYDNINSFCQHLSAHIVLEKDSIKDASECGISEKDNCTFNVYDEQDAIVVDNYSFINHIESSDINTSSILENEFNQLEDDLIIEELDNVEEIYDNCNVESLVTSPKITNMDKLKTNQDQRCQQPVALNCSSRTKSFEECFLQEMNEEKLRNDRICIVKDRKHQGRPKGRKKPTMQELLRLKGKRKKVTTVKVIAVKNRIAELYERIKIEEKNRSLRISDADKNDDNSIKMTLENEVSNRSKEEEVQSQIIGETVITLIPESCNIPNALPSANDREVDGTDLKNKISSVVDSNLCHADVDNTVCPACGKRFRSSFSLTIHKRIHYLESDSSVKLAHKCSDCDQLFNKISQLKDHVKAVHYPEGFVCKICTRKFGSLSLLERHMRKVHLNRPFNCKQCGKNFANRLTYDEHSMSHISGEVYKCHICGRKYPTEYFLMEHLRNHKEQIPQTCVVCGKVTLRITQHMKIHTPRPKRLLLCSICGKVFNFSSGLSHHIKVKHKSSTKPMKRKKPLPNHDKEKRSKKPHSRNARSKNHCSTTVGTREGHAEYNTKDESVELQLESQEVVNYSFQDLTNHTNEEEKRVIVELIENSNYTTTTFFPDNLSSTFDTVPPIAREETITAVNSIMNDW